MASNYSNKRKSRMSQFKLKARNDEAYRGRHVESQGSLKARPFAPVSQAVNENKKFLKEIKSATPGNIQIFKKENSLTADIKKDLVVNRSDHVSVYSKATITNLD